MISDKSVALLSEQWFSCQIAPSTIVRGTNVKISTLTIPALVIPMKIHEVGDLEINVSLRETESKEAAA